MGFYGRLLIGALLFGTGLDAGLAMAQSAAPAAPKRLGDVNLCAAGPDAASLYSDNALKDIDKKLATGQAVCAQQQMRLIGVAQGRTYVYWTATLAEKSGDDGAAGANHVIGQIGETDEDGVVKMIYRFGNEGADEFDPHVTERGGDVFIALDTPYQIVLVRDDHGFSEIPTNFYYLDAAKVKAELPDGYIAQAPEDPDSYRSTFNATDLSVSVRVEAASEVFPRQYVKPDYDRNTLLRFPLERHGQDLVPGKGEVVEDPEDFIGGIGETPLIVSVPKDTRVCDLQAYLKDTAPDGVSVRARPDAKSAVVANLPAAIVQSDGNSSFGAQVDIVGVEDGWFLIENASHPFEMFEPPEGTSVAPGIGANAVRASYRGRGWIEGSKLVSDIQAGSFLRASKDEDSAPVFDLKPDDSEVFNTATAFLDCDGGAVKMDVVSSTGEKGQGWLDASNDGSANLCANQGTTCN